MITNPNMNRIAALALAFCCYCAGFDSGRNAALHQSRPIATAAR